MTRKPLANALGSFIAGCMVTSCIIMFTGVYNAVVTPPKSTELLSWSDFTHIQPVLDNLVKCTQYQTDLQNLLDQARANLLLQDPKNLGLYLNRLQVHEGKGSEVLGVFNGPSMPSREGLDYLEKRGNTNKLIKSNQARSNP